MNGSLRRIDFIDYLRGIAILSVYFFHSLGASFGGYQLPWGWLARSFDVPLPFLATLPFQFGFMGVPLFFVISGFCIHISFKQQGQQWGPFFIRRFFRIYPAYLIATLLFAFCFTQTLHDFWFQFIRHALLIHNFNIATIHGLNGSFWTIAIEFQLYLVYPLLLALVAKFGWRRTLICLACCEIFLQMWDFWAEQFISYGGAFSPFIFHHVTPVVNKIGVFVDNYSRDTPLGFWFSWSLGAYVADAFLNDRQISVGKSPVVNWIILVLAAFLLKPLAPLFFLFSAVLAAKLIAKHFNSRRPRTHQPGFWLNQLRLAGVYSYGIYLLHQPLLETMGALLNHFFPGLPSLSIFLCCAAFWPVMMFIGALSWRFIEQPGIAMGKKLIARLARKKNPLEPLREALISSPSAQAPRDKSESRPRQPNP